MRVLSRVPGWYRSYPILLRVVVVVSAARVIEATYRRLLGKPPPTKEARCHCLATPRALPTFDTAVSRCRTNAALAAPSYKTRVPTGNRTPIPGHRTCGRNNLTAAAIPWHDENGLSYSYPRHHVALSQLRLKVTTSSKVVSIITTGVPSRLTMSDVSTTNRREGS